MKAKKKLKTISGIKDFSVCCIERIVLVIVFDKIKIYNLDIQSPIYSIKLDSSPRQAKLSPNGKFFIILQSDFTINLYNTYTGLVIQKITNVPVSTKTIKFSKNSQKIIFASSQMLCIWDIKSCSSQMRTQTWKNINCYDINEDGSQIAVGIYNGIIFLIKHIQMGRYSEGEITRHQNCIMSVCFHKDKLISVSYNGHLLITTISQSQNGQRQLSFKQLNISSIPRQIQSIGNRFYFINYRGITWLKDNYMLVGLVDDRIYKPIINQDKQLIFVKLIASQMQWWTIQD